MLAGWNIYTASVWMPVVTISTLDGAGGTTTGGKTFILGISSTVSLKSSTKKESGIYLILITS